MNFRAALYAPKHYTSVGETLAEQCDDVCEFVREMATRKDNLTQKSSDKNIQVEMTRLIDFPTRHSTWPISSQLTAGYNNNIYISINKMSATNYELYVMSVYELKSYG